MVAVRILVACLLLAAEGNAWSQPRRKGISAPVQFRLDRAESARRRLCPLHLLSLSLDPWTRLWDALTQVVRTQVELPVYAKWTLVSPVFGSSSVSTFLRYQF